MISDFTSWMLALGFAFLVGAWLWCGPIRQYKEQQKRDERRDGRGQGIGVDQAGAGSARQKSEPV